MLGSDSWRQREAATNALRPVVPLVEPELRLLAQGQSEVAHRARKLLADDPKANLDHRLRVFLAAVKPAGDWPWSFPYTEGLGREEAIRWHFVMSCKNELGPFYEGEAFRKATGLYLADRFASGEMDEFTARALLADWAREEAQWRRSRP